jgi:hypothetical protein
MNDLYLKHFGVTGMKWGRRLGSDPAYTSRSGKVQPKTRSYKGVVTPVDRRGRPLSEAGLKQMKQELKSLSKEKLKDIPTDVVDRGHKLTGDDVLKVIGGVTVVGIALNMVTAIAYLGSGKN